MAQHSITQKILKIVELMIENKIIKSRSAMARSLSYRPQSYDKVKNSDRNFPLEVIHSFITLYKINPILLFDDKAWKEVCNDDGEIMEYDALLLQSVTEEHPSAFEKTNTPISVIKDTQIQSYIAQHQNAEYIDTLQRITCNSIDIRLQQGRAIQVKGDDMEPNFVHGDWIIGSVIKNYSSLLYNRIYVLVTDKDILVRRIVDTNNEKGIVTVGMDNHGYPNYSINIDTVLEIWEVHHVLKSRFPVPL